MTFGWSQTSAPVDETVAKAMVNKFITFNQKQKPSPSDSDSSTQHYIDTARIYAGGATEPIVGATIADAASYCDRDGHVDSLLLGTKAHPSQANGLSATGIRQQFDASIEAMSRGVSVSSVAEYYLHQPDPNNSLLESLKCLNELVKEKKVH